MAKSKNNRIVLRVILITIVVIIGILGGTAATLVANALKTVPSLEDIKFSPKLATSIYDRNGQLIQRLFIENRIWAPIAEIPKNLQEAIIAVEDHEFYSHHGVNPKAILRSLFLNIKTKSLSYGGSTITQQLAKNAFLTQEKKLARKVKEAIWAIQIERAYTKDEILETYLNEIWFGHGAYGVEAAAQLYFGKHVDELNLEEMALIAGVTNNPSLFSPRVNMEKAKSRRDLVLKRMWEEGYISKDIYQETIEKPIVLYEKVAGSKKTASYFIETIQHWLLEKYGYDKVYSGGLEVYTTLDLNMQKLAEETLLTTLPNGGTDKNGLTQPQGALITINNKTGEILAMVGGRGEDKLNRALQTYRQPGSSIKPFIYATALGQGYTPASIFVDEPIEYKLPSGELWPVRNYHRDYRGPMTLRYALEMSTNVIAVQLLDKVSVDAVIKTIKKLGITSLIESGQINDKGLSPLALGALTKGVSLVQMAAAYGAFANQGIYYEPFYISRIEEPNGKVIFINHSKPNVALDEKVAYVLTDMLKGVVTSGTAKQANIGRPQAGKTGTTDNYQDAWYVGFTPELVTAIWVGEDFPKEMIYNDRKYGSWDCASIWGKYMKKVVADTEPTDFLRPSGLTDLDICTESGLIAQANCPNVRKEIFISGSEPKALCTLHEPQSSNRDRNMIPLDLDFEEDETDTGTNFMNSLLDLFGKQETKPEPKPIEETEDITTQQPSNENNPDIKAGDNVPDYLVTVELCGDSGKVATPACPASKIYKINYLKGTEPTEECDIHGGEQ